VLAGDHARFASGAQSTAALVPPLVCRPGHAMRLVGVLSGRAYKAQCDSSASTNRELRSG
jgi:hypothetical protein